MAKFCDTTVFDGFFGVLDDGNRQVVCYQQPTTYAEVTTYRLAEATMTPTTDYTKAQGDAGVGTRKCTMAAKSGVSITAGGTATHVAIANSTGTVLLYVTTCTSQNLTSGGTVNIPAWKVEIAAPT